MFLLEGRELSLQVSQDDDEAFLLDQCRQLHAAWKRFCKKLPDDEQKTLYENLPSIRYLHESVTKASETWQGHQNSKIGRLMKIFTGLCNTLDTHSNLVSIIPTDDKYVRLLTGSLSAITQATVNHRKLADGVADSLEELSEDMGYWNELISDHPRDAKMHRYLIQIYVVVFEFLTEVFLQWSKSSWNSGSVSLYKGPLWFVSEGQKKFITSFDQNAFQRLFEEKRKRIKTIEGYMQRRANLVCGRQVKHDQEDIRARQTRMESRIQDMGWDNTCHIQALYRLGSDTHNLLRPYALSLKYPVGSSASTPYLLAPSPSIKAIEDINTSGDLDTAMDVAPKSKGRDTQSGVDPKPEGRDAQNDMKDSWQGVLEALSPVFTKFGRDIEDLVEITEIKVEHDTRRRIGAWTTSTDSDQLWIQGCHDTSHPSQSTLLAAYLSALSTENDIPCVTYFCSLQIHNADEMVPSRCQMLLGMVKSLIAQLLLISKQTQAKVDIPLEPFNQLTNPDLDLKTALTLLRETRSIMPPLLHCLIDGVQELEDRGDTRQTADLQEVLQEIMSLNQTPALVSADSLNHEGGGATTQAPVQTMNRQVKLCFTSDGYVDALARMVQAGQLEGISHEDGRDELRDDDDDEILARYEED
ncbi:hypothetical protein GGR51DRAFT_421276 [Nemania sp. FL0031]|nr:hypothetical protein GGR51DRAFT_421276 [Nemania sp. FL0031]